MMTVNYAYSLKTLLMKFSQWFVCKNKNEEERDRKSVSNGEKEGEKECAYL